MSEKKTGETVNFSENFYRMVAFALIMMSIVIFFGTIFMGSYAIWGKGPAVMQKFGPDGLQRFSQAVSGDFIMKGLLTAIFVMLFALVFMLNDLLRVLKSQNKLD